MTKSFPVAPVAPIIRAFILKLGFGLNNLMICLLNLQNFNNIDVLIFKLINLHGHK
ncbi:hypothetical protein GCM10022217_39290 [Chryseobacterium ginsenosidimutans]